MIENEFKIMLSKEQYDAIHTFYSWDTEVEQVNWYYDSESGELSGRHITCRVRTLGGRFYLQVKLPAHENSSGAVSRIELERELTSIPEFISGQELSEFSGAAGLPDVKLLGSLSTYRSVKRFDGAEIDLDKSEYFGRTDFELEVEYTDEASAQAAVRAVVLTLCSIEPVERVQLQLLGGAGLQYCAIDASIAPDSAWLE